MTTISRRQMIANVYASQCRLAADVLHSFKDIRDLDFRRRPQSNSALSLFYLFVSSSMIMYIVPLAFGQFSWLYVLMIMFNSINVFSMLNISSSNIVMNKVWTLWCGTDIRVKLFDLENIDNFDFIQKYRWCNENIDPRDWCFTGVSDELKAYMHDSSLTDKIPYFMDESINFTFRRRRDAMYFKMVWGEHKETN